MGYLHNGMTFGSLQQQVAPWAEHNFPGDSRSTLALGEVEEILELIEALQNVARRISRATVKLEQGIRGTPEEWLGEVRKELGDVIIKAAHVAEGFGMDLQDIVEGRWADIQRRDWKANSLGHGKGD